MFTKSKAEEHESPNLGAAGRSYVADSDLQELLDKCEDKYIMFGDIQRLKVKSGREMWGYLERIYDTIIEPDFIAENYGAGRYRIQYTIKQPGHKNIYRADSVTIEPDAAILKNKTPQIGSYQPQIQQANPAAANNIELIKIMFDTITQLSKNNNGKNSDSLDFSKISDAMQNMLITNFESNTKMLNQIAKANTIGYHEAEPEQQPETITSKIFDFLVMAMDKYGSKLLSANPVTQKIYSEFAQERPEVQEILSQPLQYKEAYNMLKSNGYNDTDDILKILNIPLPDELLSQMGIEQPGQSDKLETAEQIQEQ